MKKTIDSIEYFLSENASRILFVIIIIGFGVVMFLFISFVNKNKEIRDINQQIELIKKKQELKQLQKMENEK